MCKVLLLSHISPPIHGASLIGDSVLSCLNESSYFKVEHINISTQKNLKISLKKYFYSFFNFILILIKTVKKLILFAPNIVYITPTVINYGFYKDFLLIAIVKFYKFIFNKQIRIILHIHMRPYKNSYIKKKLYPFVFNSCEVILLSSLLIKDFDFNRFSNCLIHILPNFNVSNNNYTAFNRTYIRDIKNDNVNILYLGHMIESKGFKRALFLADKICKTHKNFKFNFYGDFFDTKNRLYFDKFLIDNNLMDNVKYFGFCSSDQKMDVFFSNHLLILPSYSEAFPLVILESLANGLSVVASNVGAVSEIINDNGSLVQTNDDESVYLENFRLSIFYTIKNSNMSKSIASVDYINANYSYDIFKDKLLTIFNKL